MCVSGAKKFEFELAEKYFDTRSHQLKTFERNNIETKGRGTKKASFQFDNEGKPGTVRCLARLRPERGEPILSGVKITTFLK